MARHFVVSLLLNHYGFALPTRSPLLESINRAILAHIQRPEWHDIVYRYTGDEF
jgi:hypothetical protein